MSTSASAPTENTAAASCCTFTEQVGMDEQDWKVISKLKGNEHCMDCYALHPKWACVRFGVLVCTRCCGAHRALRKNMSQVRSVTMDSWTRHQVERMKAGGNQSLQNWLERAGIHLQSSIDDKYDTTVAMLYAQEILLARIQQQQQQQQQQEGPSSSSPPSSSSSLSIFPDMTLEEAQRRYYAKQHNEQNWWSYLFSTINNQHLMSPPPQEDDDPWHCRPLSDYRPILQRIQNYIFSSDVYMVAYIVSLVGLPVFFFLYVYS